MSDLKTWSKNTIGSVPKKLGIYRKRLEVLATKNDTNSHKERKRLLAEMEELLHKEEILWRQSARALWLKEGDRNTSFFDRKASWRAKKNRISSLLDNNGRIVTDGDHMGKLTNEFFSKLYTKDDSVNPDLITEHMQKRVNADMNLEISPTRK